MSKQEFFKYMVYNTMLIFIIALGLLIVAIIAKSTTLGLLGGLITAVFFLMWFLTASFADVFLYSSDLISLFNKEKE